MSRAVSFLNRRWDGRGFSPAVMVVFLIWAVSLFVVGSFVSDGPLVIYACVSPFASFAAAMYVDRLGW